MKYARWIGVNNGRALQGREGIEDFVANFVRLEQLYLFDWRTPSFDWRILRNEAFLRLIFLNLQRQTVEIASEISVNELCRYLSDVMHINRGRTVRIEHGWKWPQTSLYKITKVRQSAVYYRGARAIPLDNLNGYYQPTTHGKYS